MAQRIYLPSSGTAPITNVGFDAAWELTSIGARLPCFPYKKSTAMTTVSFVDADKLDKDVLFRQFISPPLLAQTIAAQTVKFQIRAMENHTGNNMFTAIGIRAVSNDGTVARGTILAVTRDATEVVNGTLTNRQFFATSTALAVSEGDRLVIEIGTGGDPAATSNGHTSDMRIGDAAASDLLENDTDTTDLNPWVEFVTLSFRETEYKFFNVRDGGSQTNYKVKINKVVISPFSRQSILTTQTYTLSGSNSVAQCRTDCNNNYIWKYGVPIVEQR